MTDAGPVALHVYVRLDSPSSLAPRVVRFVVVPSTGFGVAAAGFTIVGATSATVTEAFPDTEPSVAVTVAVPT